MGALTINPGGSIAWNDAIAKPTEADQGPVMGTADYVIAEAESVSPEDEEELAALMADKVAGSIIESAFVEMLAHACDDLGEDHLASALRADGLVYLFGAHDEAVAYAKSFLTDEELKTLEDEMVAGPGIDPGDSGL